MEKWILSALLGLIPIITQAQTAIYKLLANTNGYTQSVATNVLVTKSPRWSLPANTNCGVPSCNFADADSNFNANKAVSGTGGYTNFNFILEPSNGYIFSVDSITFKISGDSINGVACKAGLSLHTKSAASIVSDVYLPNNIACMPQSPASYAFLSKQHKWIPNLNNYGTNSADSFFNCYLFFYHSLVASNIRVTEITVWGCVSSLTALKDCNNAPRLFRSTNDYSKYQLFLADEFDGNTYNKNTWYPRVGVNGFKGINRDQNNSVSNGMLHIAYTADSVPSSTPGKLYDTAYYTGGLITQNNFKYGYFELKTRLFAPSPGIRGFHQSFWSHGINRNAYIKANELSGTGAGQEIQCFEHDSYDKKLHPSIYNHKNPNNQFYAYYMQQINDIDVSGDFFTAAYEILPDSIKIYFNGKLRIASKFDEDLQRELLATQVWVTPTPTPQGYWKLPCPIPPPGAEMTVDYYRYYLPKSPVGYNFLSNFIFSHGRTKITNANKRNPVAWANPRTKDIMGNNLAFDTIAATLDSTIAYPDKLNEKWSMLHKHSAPYRTATRQMLEAIPNGTYLFTAYIKCSNKIGDTVELRVRTRNSANTADTLYRKSVNNFNNIADKQWRKVSLLAVPIYNNQAVVEMYSSAAANSYTYFDSLVFTGMRDTFPTVTKSGCDGGSIKLIATKDIPETTTYQWQVSTFSNGAYSAWANLGNWGTGLNSTNGFGASYKGALTDTLLINGINPRLKNARYRCLMITPATNITSIYERYSPVFFFDSINPPIKINAAAKGSVYLGGTLRLDADYTGGSGVFNDFFWTGPNQFRDTSLHSFVSNFSENNNGIYRVFVTDDKGCFYSDTLMVSALPKPVNPVLVQASYNRDIRAFNNLNLTCTVTNGSGRLAYEWLSPQNQSIGISKSIQLTSVTVDKTGRYAVFVFDSATGFIASDTISVVINKRGQTISFNVIPSLSSYNAATSVGLVAASSLGLPIGFQSSNTALAAIIKSNTLSFARVRPDYSITLTEPITTNKIRLISTQSAHFHIRELRVYAPNRFGYPTNILTDGGEASISGLKNVALQAAITASGQYAPGLAYIPQNAIDSSLSTSWVSQPNGILPAEKWLQLTFPNTIAIGNIQFVSGFFSGGTWNAPVTLWKLQYWDGVNWVDLNDCKVTITAIQSGDNNTDTATADQWLCVNTNAKSVTNITQTLPLTQLIITTKLITENRAEIRWLSVNQNPVKIYILEKSTDGLFWKNALMVQPHPSSNAYVAYDTLERAYTAMYYRIKVIDAKNDVYYSSVQKLYLSNRNLSSEINVYPNPAFAQLYVQINTSVNFHEAKFYIFHSTGKKVWQQKINNKSPLQIDIRSFSNGLYYVVFQSATTKYATTFLKQ